MLKIKTGKVPNLPLWRLQKMSDEEIEKFNNGFMMIERLEENAQAIEKIKSMLELKEMTYKEQAFKNIEGRIDSIQKLSIECVEYIYLAAYNEAIEAAAKIIDDCNREGPYNAIGGARRIRELKK